jgi:hypothetical protein
VHREHHPHGQRLDQLDQLLEPLRVVHVARPVCRERDVLARLETAILENRRALLRDVTERERDVRHHVAHEVDLAGRPLTLEVPDRRLGRAEEEVAGVVRQHAVQLLGHGAVE